MNKREATLYEYQFFLKPTPELFDLRNKILQGVFQLYQIDIFQKKVMNLIHQYSNSFSWVPVSKIIKKDSLEVLNFIEA